MKRGTFLVIVMPTAAESSGGFSDPGQTADLIQPLLAMGSPSRVGEHPIALMPGPSIRFSNPSGGAGKSRKRLARM